VDDGDEDIQGFPLCQL